MEMVSAAQIAKKNLIITHAMEIKTLLNSANLKDQELIDFITLQCGISGKINFADLLAGFESKFYTGQEFKPQTTQGNLKEEVFNHMKKLYEEIQDKCFTFDEDAILGNCDECGLCQCVDCGNGQEMDLPEFMDYFRKTHL
ncbi:MAG: hypothetical protein ACM3UU_00455 [Ignavibacteriales bacterium]